MRKVAFLLSLILIFIIPWENVVVFDGLGTVSRAAGVLVGAFWVLTVVVTGEFRKPQPFHVAVYLFVLWNLLSAIWSVDIDRTVDYVLTYFQLAILIFILWDLYTTPEALKAGLQAYVLGAYVAIGSTIANYLTGVERGYLRYSATGFNPNDLGLMLALGIPVAWHLAISEGSGRRADLLQLVNYAYLPAATLAILLTGSRGAIVAALPAFIYVLGSLLRLRLFSRILIGTALVGSLLAVQSLAPQSSFNRLATIGTSVAESDLGGRVDIWSQGIDIFSENSLLGIGGGAFRAIIESGKAPHNSFLSVLVEVGIIGFALFAIILAIVVYQAVRQLRLDSSLWLAILSVWALGAFSLGWVQRKPTWLFLSLAVASAAMSMPSVKAARAEGFLQEAIEQQHSLG